MRRLHRDGRSIAVAARRLPVAPLYLIVVIVLAIACSACNAQRQAVRATDGSVAAVLPSDGASSLGAAPMTGDSGSRLLAGSGGPSAYEAFITVTVQPRGPTEEASGTPGGMEYEIARVQIEGESGAYSYSFANFSFLGSAGGVYQPDVSDPRPESEKALGSGVVTAGHRIEGYVVFKVPLGGGQVQLRGPLGPSMAWKTHE
jgi:hypothetical protein